MLRKLHVLAFVVVCVSATAAVAEPRGLASVEAAMDRKPLVRLIVELAPHQNTGRTSRDEISALNKQFIARAQGFGGQQFAEIAGTPFVVFVANKAMIDLIKNDDSIIAVQEDIAVPPTLPQSGPLVGAPTAWAAGARGAGTSVAILDTGVDSTHPFLAGRVEHEACFSTTDGGQGSSTVCSNGSSQQIAVGSAKPCAISGCEHGTHVAGIAAGKGQNFSGMAPDTGIVAVQIFSRFDDHAGGATPCLNARISSPCLLSFTSDQMRGLAYIRDLAPSYSVAAVNMSLGGGLYTAQCTSDVRRTLVAQLNAMHVATVVAAGNDSSTNAVSAPACVPGVVVVGSTTKTDAVSPFSNSSPLVNLLAPGSGITSSVPGGGFSSFSGTSMATPHVTGAIADLHSVCPSSSVADFSFALAQSGRTVIDPRNGLSRPRINIGAAATLLKTRANSPIKLMLYRPGTGTFWAMALDGTKNFFPLIHEGDPGSGIAGYDLKSRADLMTTFDYNSSGKPDHLVIYRPGTGTIWILAKSTCGVFSPVYRQGDPGSGIGGYDLKSPADRAFAFDYDGSGNLDHLVLYRPGTGTMWIMAKDAAGRFSPVYHEGDPGSGIGGYDLKSPADRAFAFDYDGTGKLDHLVLYRPGTGTLWIMAKDAAGRFSPVYHQGDPGSGIGGYDLKSPADRAFAFDYDGSGKLDHLVLYRPGTGTLWIMAKDAAGRFSPVYHQGDPGNGIGGYDLKSRADRAFALDYDGTGKLDHLVLYRPGTGTLWIMAKDAAGRFSPVYHQGDPGNGIGGYDLKSPADRVLTFGSED